MGGTSTSTQTQTIPQNILQRYDQVNARAEEVAQTPFHSYDGQFVAPLTGTQQAGIANTNVAAGQAQPYYDAATGQLYGAQSQAQPYYAAATQGTQSAQGVGNLLAGSSLGALTTAQAQAQGYNQQAGQGYGQAFAGAQGYNQQAGQGYGQAFAGAQPYQQGATGLAVAGTQAVNPTDLNGAAISKYLSPYLSTVLGSTAGLLNQQNQQAMSGQTGNAISQGAFGGDRAGIAAANLNQQQQIANANIFSGILNQGYGQALSTAQQQQGVGLAAGQANREALQQGANQIAAIGQQGYAQGTGTASAQQGLGQQVYGQGTGTASAQQGLGQQVYGQGATTAQQMAALGQQQFGQGLTAAQQQQSIGQGLYGMGAATSQALAGLGTGAQASALQGAQAQIAAGQTEQQTQQAQDTALYNQFLQQQSYPFQTAQFLANIAEGTGALSGSTTTTQQPGGLFSDRRLKENVHPIGETYDGQKIYKYNYKGDNATQIGLIAQEVEKHHPQAVGLAGGYRTVNYDDATQAAADRGHFAGGGVVTGFDPVLMQQILGNAANMYGPYNAAGGVGIGTGAGLPGGGSARVPAANLPVTQLRAPSGGVAPPANMLHDAADTAKSVEGLAKSARSMRDLVRGKTEGQYPLANDDVYGLAPDSELPDNSDGQAYYATGGRIGLAAGGMPYVQQIDGPALDIPTEQPDVQALSAPGTVGKPGSTTGDIKNLASAAASIAMLFSDRRLKENIEPIGETYDGQKIYKYNFKGDKATQIGLIAQDVAKVHPTAVGQSKGYRTVDYDKATSDAASRGHFAGGGQIGDDLEEEVYGDDPTADQLLEASPDDVDTDVAAPPSPMDITADIGDGGAAIVPDPPTAVAAQSVTGGGNRAERNNNPGNIEDGKFARSIPGYVGSDGRFAVFDSPKSGRSAQVKLLESYLAKGVDTPLKIAARWAPAGDGGNDPNAYAGFIAKRLGLAPDDKVGVADLGKLAVAQGNMEGYRRAFAGGGLAAALPDDFLAGVDTPPAVEPDADAYQQPSEPSDLTAGMKSLQSPSSADGMAAGLTPRDHNFIKGIGRGEATSIMPILSALAAIGTAPTQHLGTALFAGLGAGVGSYQGQRDFQLKQLQAQREAVGKQQEQEKIDLLRNLNPVQRQQIAAQAGLAGATADAITAKVPSEIGLTTAQTGLTGAQASNITAKTQPEVAALIAQGRLGNAQAQAAIATQFDLLPPVKDGSGVIHIYGVNKISHQTEELTGAISSAPAPEVQGQPSVTGGGHVPQGNPLIPPTASPAPPLKSVAPKVWRPITDIPVGMQGPDPLSQLLPGFEQQKAADYHTLQGLEEQARQASAQLGTLQNMNQQVANLPVTGWGSMGAGATVRNNILKTVNAYSAVLGGGPIANTSPGENLTKFTNTLGIGLARSLGNREAASVINMAINTNPSLENSPMGYHRLTSAMTQGVQRERDAATFYQNYFSKFQTLQGAREQFDKLNPPQMYAKKAIMGTVPPKHVAELRANRKDPEAIAQFNAKYGAGVASYFLGQ